MILIAPSILAADVLNLQRDVEKMVQAGCDWLHIDVMDGHFVPNLAYSPAVVKRLKQQFAVPLDVHLMMSEPEKYLEVFLDAGADTLTIHGEVAGDVPGMLRAIHQRGRKAGVALKPGTALEKVQAFLPEADMVLMMTVEPGFGGQKLDEKVLPKIRTLHESGYAGLIEADGGIGEGNLQALLDCGLDVAVMGSALFKQQDPVAAICRLHGMGGKTEGS